MLFSFTSSPVSARNGSDGAWMSSVTPSSDDQRIPGRAVTIATLPTEQIGWFGWILPSEDGPFSWSASERRSARAADRHEFALGLVPGDHDAGGRVNPTLVAAT